MATFDPEYMSLSHKLSNLYSGLLADKGLPFSLCSSAVPANFILQFTRQYKIMVPFARVHAQRISLLDYLCHRLYGRAHEV